ncbi:MAG: mechanosensitive ion channel domain-containing protein [Betaproteobacteria bacterium]
MPPKSKAWRRRIVVLLALACLPFATISCNAAGSPAAAQAVALPATLTPESVRDLLSRLSDQQVRGLLLEQLDRAAKPSPAPGAGGMFAMGGMTQMAGMAGMVDQNAGTLRGRLEALYAACVALPSTLRGVAIRLSTANAEGGAAEPAQFWRRLGELAAMLVAGWIALLIYRRALRNFRARLMHPPANAYFARAFQLGVGLALDLSGIGVFALVAFAVYLALDHAHELWRILMLATLIACVVVQVVQVFARFLLDTADGHDRLLPFADAPARRLRGFAISLSILFGVFVMALSLLGAAGAPMATLDVLRAAGGLAGLAITLAAVWRMRRPIAQLIRGNGDHGAIRGWIADLWPVAATAYFLMLFIASISSMLAGSPGPLGLGFASVLVVLALPIVDLALCRGLAAAAVNRRPTGDAPLAGMLRAYEPIFRRAIHIVIVVAGILLLAEMWQLRLFDYARSGVGGRIAGSLLGISIVLLATYLAWEITRTAIDRRLSAEAEQSDDIPSTRLRTVLPILRVTIMVTIAVMATMSVLAALGMDILPLLAGASIVGVAIGFGAQTLVRDVVSGAFFLMDDAFRLGEYIEVGDAKGRVEKINLRSVFLRHHRGAINVLPYGEIHRLRNTSRDWMVHVMEFRLTYDTNLLQVKNIVKKIGQELADDADYAPDIVQPLKSAGVMAAEDSAIVVRVKFTSKPTNNAWVVRRVAYDKIIRAFRDAGIRFAHRQVTVNAPSSPDPGALALATAGSVAAVAVDPGVVPADAGSRRG